jgi:pimeloyl-ACP methyl ester carboxylesterase
MITFARFAGQETPAMDRVKTNGVELACEAFGASSDEAVLLIAGLGTQMIRWTAPFCHLLAARGYQVIRFDNRDAGCSTHLSHRGTPDFGALAAELMAGRAPDVPYTLHDMAADAVGLLDAFSIDRAHVVGRSMGGMIAQLMACEHPDRIASLTSIMSSTGNPALPPPMPDVMAMMTRPASDPLSDEAGYLAHSLAFARRIAGSRYPFDEVATRRLVLEEVRRAGGLNGFGRQIAAIAADGERRGRLATVSAPALVIHGSDDPLFPPACGEDTAASIPAAEFMLIEGMGHDLPPQSYGAVIEAIDRTARRRP